MKVGIPVITPEKNEHLKELVEQFFADKKNFRYNLIRQIVFLLRFSGSIYP